MIRGVIHKIASSIIRVTLIDIGFILINLRTDDPIFIIAVGSFLP